MRVLLQNKKTGKVVSIDNVTSITFISNVYHVTSGNKTSHYSAKDYTISMYN